MLHAIALLLALVGPPATAQEATPPRAAQVPHVVHSAHGDRADAYHWLRDDNPTKRPEVLRYLEAENAYTAARMAPLAPLQRQLVREMRARLRDDERGVPVYDGGWWTWHEYRRGAEHPVLMRQRGSPQQPDARAQPELLLDENARAAGQPYYQVGTTALSPDGRVLAWTEDTAGRRRHTLRFRDLARGRDLPDTIEGVQEDVVWANDSRTVLYIRQDPVTLQSGPVHRHRLGDLPANDTIVHDEPDPTLSVTLARSASRRYLLIDLSGTDTNETRVADADAPGSPARVVLARRAQVRFDADHLDGHWVIRTNEGAPNFRLVRAPEAAPDDRTTWRELVPAREQIALEAFVLTRQGIALEERVRGDTRVRLLREAQHAIAVEVPEAVSVALGDNRDPEAAHLRYTVTSMVQPRATWDWHLASGRRLLRQTQPVPGYDASRYATRRLWAAARDGQKVPVTLAWRVDRARADGSAPLLLLGYGAYGLSYDATFVPDRVSLLDRGFVVAIAHVRGGAELGQAWYEAGRLMNKHNTFNDFIDATDELVKAGWGDPRRVFASGGSAGGLLMGVVANQGGQRYRGIVLDVPFVDAVTTMLDETIPLTANEWTQWGDPREKADYDYMLAYSPYDNIAARPYPAMLVSTGLQDSQVQYYEPAKYVARLRATKTDDNPLLLHVNMQAGHGGVSGRYASLADVAREYAFLIDLAQPRPHLAARKLAPAPMQTSAHAPSPRPAPVR